MIEQSGGRAGPHELGFVQAGYELDEIEELRQELLSQNDVGKVQRALGKLGITLKRNIIQAVKNYVFDSQGIGFTYQNYAAWRRLATKKGTIGDAAYLIHEIAEIEELQRIQKKIGFNFRKTDFKVVKELRQWRNDFDRYYKQAHSKALEAEYDFIAEQVVNATNGKIKISRLQAGAIDPTRLIKHGSEETEAALYLLVDGIPMQFHYNAWLRRANEIVSLSKSTQRRLQYYRKEITLKELIRYIKRIRIN